MFESPRWIFLREIFPGLDNLILLISKSSKSLKLLLLHNNNRGGGISLAKLPKNIIYGLFIIFLGYFAAFSILWRLDNPTARITPILTGSMEPTIPTGSLIITSISENYYVGDIITYREIHPQTGVETDRTLTHRIIATKDADKETLYVAQGDASRVPDINDIQKQHIYGKMIYSIPYAGYIYTFVRTIPGFLFLIGLPAFLLINNEIKYLRHNRVVDDDGAERNTKLNNVIAN